MNSTTLFSNRQQSFKGMKGLQDNKNSNNQSSSMSENIEDEEEREQQYCPKKPNQEFSNSKIITAAASTYIAQELQHQFSTNSQNGFSPDQIEKQSQSKLHHANQLNDTGALIRDFDITSIDNRIASAAFTTKQKQKTQSRFMNASLLKSSTKSLYNEDRPLQMTKNFVGRSTAVQSKKVSSSNLKLGSGTFDSINPNNNQNVSSTKNILKSGLMSTTHQNTAKNIHKMKRVRSQTSAKQYYDFDQHNNSSMMMYQTNQSGFNNNIGPQQTLQFEFGVHKPTGNKLSLGISPYYSPHNQSTTCFMQAAQRTMKHQNSSDSHNFNQQFMNNFTQSNLNFLQNQQYQLQQQRLMNNSSSMNFMPNTFQEQHESLDNLYTLKKVQSKVKDRLVPWIDLQSTSATMNNNNNNYHNHLQSSSHHGNYNNNGSIPRQTEESMAFSHQNKISLGAINTMDQNNYNYQSTGALQQNQQNDSSSMPVQTESGVGILKFAKLQNLVFSKKNQETSTAKKQYGSPPDKMSIYNFTQVHSNGNDKNKRTSQDKDFFNEESLCITEENRFQNEINPIKLADLEWGDQYKLDKLMRQQARQINEGWIDPNTYFGYDDLMIEQAFQWFDIAKRDMEVYMMKRKSSTGLVAQNTFVNQSIADFGTSNFKLQTSGTMMGFGNQRGMSIIMGGGEIQDQVNIMQTESSSDDEGGDEVEKFRNTFLKGKKGSKFMFMKGKRNNQNLLIKSQEQFEVDQDDDEGFNNITPKVLSSNDNSDEDEKEDRPMQMRTNFKVLEELIEESREESLRADSNMHFHIPIQIDQNQHSNNQALLQQINQDELEELQEENHTEANQPQTNRLYDSDIFVMSNTTFDEDLASISSRRVSQGKQPYRNEFLSFVDNSQDLSILKSQGLAHQQQLEGITNKLFFHQQNQQLLQRRQQKFQQQQNTTNDGSLSTRNNIAMKNQHVKQKQQKTNKTKEKPLTSSIQTLLSQNNLTHVSTNMHSVNHDKKQSLTKFSNYVSSSNNLSPIPQNIQSSFFNYKQPQNNNLRYNKSHYNSMSSINMQLYKQQPQTINSNVFQLNSGHFSILSGNSNNQTLQNSQNQQQPIYSVGKSHSNENFSKQVIAVSSTLNQNMQKMTHHSPQCSLSMGPNLSPGPGFKVKERNSLFLKDRMTRNKHSLGIAQQLSDSDLSQNKFVMLSGKQQQNGNNSIKRITNQSIQNLHKLGTQRYGDQKHSLINNSTTIDSVKHSKQNMTLGSAELKQQINAAKLRKQRSDSKLDQQPLLFEVSNSMVTQKLLASIKQNMINKKNKQDTIQSHIVNEDTYNKPFQQLNRQRSKSEIETIYEIGNKHQQLMESKNKPSNQRVNQTIAPLSPSRSLKSVGFPYNNGKTMSDINKFFDERSEHNVSLQSAINKQQNQKSNSKQSQDMNNYNYGSNQNPTQAYDMISNGSMSNIYNKQGTSSISGQGTLKEPSFVHQNSKLEILTNESGNSPQVKIFKNTSSQQSFKLNFGIQPHLVKKYQSPTSALSQSYQLSTMNQMSLSKRNESQILNNSSILQPSINKTKSIPHQMQKKDDQKTQNPQISIIKQRIAKSPNKKSMMILNSSLGSNSNNMSMIAAAIGYGNDSSSKNNNTNNFTYNSNTQIQKQHHAHHDSNSSDIVKVLEYSDQKPRQ